ncbi:MAG: hypothetical protein JSR13_05840 [Proteobacteria bacterium]|nr:hypothetical protein [Pseudomonadota bacterium]
MTADTSYNKTSVEIGRIVGWVYEDELPKSYPYDAMYPYSKVDGVRVFPVYAPSELLFTTDGKFLSRGSDGMSLRQYYAGQALAGLCANPGGPFQANTGSGWDIVNCDAGHVADWCNELADALIDSQKAGA